MKRLARITGWKFWTMLLLAGSSFTSCNVLSEEAEDCAVYVQFKYDMNMEFTNSFQHAVNSVTLYAFDKDGKLAFQKTEEGEILKQDGYRMRLDEISHYDKAEYDFIVWAGEPNNESFSIPLLTVGKHSKEDLYCQLNRAGGGIVKDDLEDLFHGQASGVSLGRAVASDSEMPEVVIPLVKNTNSIRIVLQQVSGEPLDVNDFRFTITDKNGKMNYDNTLMEDEQLTYQAWHTGNGNASMGEGEGRAAVTELNLAIAELSVARLMADENPILTITKAEDGEEVLSIPLIDCCLLYKRAKYEDLSNQEFFDREDEYNFTFFLDEYDNWVSSTIIINSWRYVLNEEDLQ